MSDSTRERLLPSSHNTQPNAFAALKERTSCILAGGQAEVKATTQVKNKFIAALCFSFLFMIVEVVGGYLANSLAIMTDAAHLLSDVGGFAVAIFAAQYASKRSQQSHTFGYHRVEVLAALASVLCSWAVTGILVAEAVHRIINPTPVNGKLMFFLALAGIAINVLNLLILGGHHHHGVGGHDHDHGHSHAGDAHSHGHSHGDAGHSHDHGAEGHDEGNINLRGAVIHVLGDFVQSIGVAVAGALIWWKQGDPRWELADPICTFFFAILVLLTTKAILRDIWDILMERVPRQIDIDKLQQGMLAIDGVAEVHDLHVWLIKPGMPILAAHITSTEVSDANAVLGSVTQYCRSFGIDHSTIQVSDTDCPCIKQPEPSSHDLSHHNHEHNQSQHDHGDSQHGHSQQGHDHSQHAHGDSQHSHVHHHQHPNGHEHGHSHNGEADHNHSHLSSDMV